MVRNVQAVWPDRKYENMRLHCFANRTDADAFMAEFGGRWFNPEKDREGIRAAGVWRQEGAYRQMTESGRLKIHAIFLRNAGQLEYD